MFSHATIGTNDMDRAVAFYEGVLGALNIGRFFLERDYAGYGDAHSDQLWVMNPIDGNKVQAVCHSPPQAPSG